MPGLVGEGSRRGLSLQRIAQLVRAGPARRFGLHAKGHIAEDHDAES